LDKTGRAKSMDRSDILWRDGSDSYSRSVQMPSCSPGEAQAVGASFAQRVRALVGESFPSLKGYNIELAVPTAGQSSGRITLPDFEVSFRVSAGRDRSYGADGQPRSCSTLAFDAEARILSLGRAEKTYETVEGVSALAGAALFAGIFFLLVKLALAVLHVVVIPALVIVGVLAIGAVAGGAAGRVIGRFVARRMGAKTARNESVVAAAADWDAFVTRVGRLMENLK
jgi:hypothetical protein